MANPGWGDLSKKFKANIADAFVAAGGALAPISQQLKVTEKATHYAAEDVAAVARYTHLDQAADAVQMVDGAGGVAKGGFKLFQVMKNPEARAAFTNMVKWAPDAWDTAREMMARRRAFPLEMEEKLKTAQEAKQLIQGVNPVAGNKNCSACAAACYQRFYGKGSSVVTSDYWAKGHDLVDVYNPKLGRMEQAEQWEHRMREAPTRANLEDLFGSKYRAMPGGIQEVAERLQASGHGSSGMFSYNYKGANSGHVVFAANVDGKVILLDGQSGKAIPWEKLPDKDHLECRFMPTPPPPGARPVLGVGHFEPIPHPAPAVQPHGPGGLGTQAGAPAGHGLGTAGSEWGRATPEPPRRPVDAGVKADIETAKRVAGGRDVVTGQPRQVIFKGPMGGAEAGKDYLRRNDAAQFAARKQAEAAEKGQRLQHIAEQQGAHQRPFDEKWKKDMKEADRIDAQHQKEVKQEHKEEHKQKTEQEKTQEHKQAQDKQKTEQDKTQEHKQAQDKQQPKTEQDKTQEHKQAQDKQQPKTEQDKTQEHKQAQDKQQPKTEQDKTQEHKQAQDKQQPKPELDKTQPSKQTQDKQQPKPELDKTQQTKQAQPQQPGQSPEQPGARPPAAGRSGGLSAEERHQMKDDMAHKSGREAGSPQQPGARPPGQQPPQPGANQPQQPAQSPPQTGTQPSAAGQRPSQQAAPPRQPQQPGESPQQPRARPPAAGPSAEERQKFKEAARAKSGRRPQPDANQPPQPGQSPSQTGTQPSAAGQRPPHQATPTPQQQQPGQSPSQTATQPSAAGQRPPHQATPPTQQQQPGQSPTQTATQPSAAGQRPSQQAAPPRQPQQPGQSPTQPGTQPSAAGQRPSQQAAPPRQPQQPGQSPTQTGTQPSAAGQRPSQQAAPPPRQPQQPGQSPTQTATQPSAAEQPPSQQAAPPPRQPQHPGQSPTQPGTQPSAAGQRPSQQ